MQSRNEMNESMTVLTVLFRCGLAARRGGRSSAGRHGWGLALQAGDVRRLYKVRAPEMVSVWWSVHVKRVLFLSVFQRCSGCATQIRRHTALQRDSTASSARCTRHWWVHWDVHACVSRTVIIIFKHVLCCCCRPEEHVLCSRYTLKTRSRSVSKHRSLVIDNPWFCVQIVNCFCSQF